MNRTSYQGVTNIIRFNPGMFITAGVLIVLGIIAVSITTGWLQFLIFISLLAAIASLTISLVVSHWIYDKTDLYSLTSLEKCNPIENENWLTINAGFDEITPTLKNQFPDINLRSLDF